MYAIKIKQQQKRNTLRPDVPCTRKKKKKKKKKIWAIMALGWKYFTKIAL